MNRTIDDLTTQLEDLRLERLRIDEREREVLDNLRTLASSPRRPAGRTPVRRSSLTFATGDYVFISNAVGHVSPRRPTARDRAGVVVDITPCRVHVKTANGDHTSRKPSNLRRLHPDDYQAIVNSQAN